MAAGSRPKGKDTKKQSGSTKPAGSKIGILEEGMHKSILYGKLKNNITRCKVCSHYCVIAEDDYGICGIRKNVGGDAYLMVYGYASGVNVDPIEKKPLFHFYPGSEAFTIGTVGCSFKCSFCQNWETSQATVGLRGSKAKISYPDILMRYGTKLMPKDIIAMCKERNVGIVAFSYNEPSVFLEYALDTMKLAKKEGMKTAYVTNGYASPEQMDMLKGYLDAVNVDLKSFNEKFYRDICKARLQPVLENIKLCHKMGLWVEVTTLFIPGENDSDEEMEKIADFIASVDKNIPWHVTAFYPSFEMMDKPPTPSETLRRAYDIGKKKLNYVYAGNIYANDMESTYCPKCSKKLIDRRGFYSVVVGLDGNKCKFCGEEIKGRF